MPPPWEILTLGPGLDPQAVGNKALRLGAALGAGLPVLSGRVIPVAAQGELQEALATAGTAGAPLPEALVSRVSRALAGLGPPPWVVRSSSPDEDEAAHTLAGVYYSELGTMDPPQVLTAAARCYAQAVHPTVLALREALGGSTAPPRLALLIQAQVTPQLAGVLFSRDPTEGPASDVLRVEWVEGSTTAVTAGLRTPATWRWCRGEDPPTALGGAAPATLGARLLALADQAEAVLGGPADLEWALTEDDALVLLQLRPITAWAPDRGRPEATTRGTWRRDADHNPAPLSPLHASLVTHLDARLSLPFRMRVEAGALYTAPRPAPPPGDGPARPGFPMPPTGADLAHWWQTVASIQLEAALVPLEAGAAQGESLHTILPDFERFYALYAGQVGPALAQARGALHASLDAALTAGADAAGLRGALLGIAPPLTIWLCRLARLVRTEAGLRPWLREGQAPPDGIPGAARFEAELSQALVAVGALGQHWDVASPTLAETPEILRQGAVHLADRPEDRLGPPRSPDRGDASAADASLRELLRLEEEDDLLFARALAALRRGALSDGKHLTERGQLPAPADVFGLGLGQLQEALENPGWRPEAPGATPPPSAAVRSEGSLPPRALWGVGSGGGVVEGRVWRADQETPPGDRQARPDAEPRILVCSALIPATAALLASTGAAAVVTDHGGLLSHGAILARELGIPAVLGTGHATAHLTQGQRLRVDADLGLVLLLS